MVLAIEDTDYQDWRADATCRIRPQSLIGEKFIECVPTQPRGAGEQAPPPLRRSPRVTARASGCCPPPQTSGSVDLDLVNNIMRLPYRERFTIILNEFGTGFAGNGAALQTALKKSDPALKALDDVLSILAKQNKTLVALADNGDEVLRPLARDRESIARFIRSSGETAAATAERSADFEENLRLFPRVPARSSVRRWTSSARSPTRSRPVADDLARSAPALNTFVTGTPAFAAESTTSLESLGDDDRRRRPGAAEVAAADQAAATRSASTSVSLTTNLGDLLLSTQEQNGVEQPGRLHLPVRRLDERLRQLRPLPARPARARHVPDLRAEAERQHQLLVVLPQGPRRHDDPGVRGRLVGELVRVAGGGRRPRRRATRPRAPPRGSSCRRPCCPATRAARSRPSRPRARSAARDDRAVQSLLDYLLG